MCPASLNYDRVTMDAQESILIIREAIKRCTRAVEDGWEDDDFASIASEVKKTFRALYEKLGWPDDGRISEAIGALKARYNASRRGLESAQEFLRTIEKEWTGKAGSGRGPADTTKDRIKDVLGW